MGNFMSASASLRDVEDVWTAQLGTAQFADDEQTRLVLEELLRRSGSAAPETLSLVVQGRFFPEGATLRELEEQEQAIGLFLAGEAVPEQAMGEEEEVVDEAERDEGEQALRELMCSDVSLAVPSGDESADPAAADGAQLLVLATKMAAHCATARDVAECDAGAVELLLPLLLQNGRLAAPGLLRNERLRRLAGCLAVAGMRVSPLWTPFLSVAAELAPTIAFFAERGWREDGAVPPGVRGPFAPLISCVATKTFVSGHAPTLLEVRDEGNGPSRLLVSKLDDLRCDYGVTLMFRVFNALWRLAGVRAHALAYEVIPLGPAAGLMHFVGDSIPLTEWDAGAILRFSGAQLEAFVRSAAGSLTACFVLGCRDRHRDNFMVRNNCELWQLDFKHVFNRTTRGVDAPRFAVPRAVREALVRRGAWEQLKLRCARALVCLRRQAGLVTQLCRAVFRGQADDDDVQRCLSSALFLGKTEAQVPAALSSYIEISVYSLKKYVKNQLHAANLERLAKK